MKYTQGSVSFMKPVKNTLTIVTIGICFWFMGQRMVLGQKQEVEKWTVETHDQTNFPLTGRHRTVSCSECHLNKVFEGTPRECEVCHWERRQDDRYRLRLGSHCADCHSPFSWKNVPPEKWNHRADVGFALEGIHRTLDCVECHGETSFITKGIGCFDCHEGNYRRTEEPDHVAAGFPTECQLCHNNNSWEGARFNHDAFVLRGRHQTAQCSECHSSGVYEGLPSECVDCHLDDYNGTNDPNHKQAGFPTDCVQCHGDNATSWRDATFSHTAFPLKGRHKTADCSECHSSGVYEGLPSECVDCHLDDYNGTNDPNHKQAGYPTDCVQCHGNNATSWEDADINHSSFWVLRGAHTTLACSACHAKGFDLPKDCYGCHAQDYNAARNPNHGAAGFPTDCEICHLPSHTSWSQAVFDHQFPLTSGRHSGLDCTDCHLSSNFRDFSCIDCHTHEKTQMDREHSGVSGYSYNSQACYSCHPQGRE